MRFRTPPWLSVKEVILLRSLPNEDGCWIWQGASKANGYGTLEFEGSTHQVHRVSYEQFVGPIPPEAVIDHLCRHRLCVNPKHLDPVTNRVNLLRGTGLAALNAAKTRCIRGHSFDFFNTYYDKAGRRACRACSTERARERAEASRRLKETGVVEKKEATLAAPSIA